MKIVVQVLLLLQHKTNGESDISIPQISFDGNKIRTSHKINKCVYLFKKCVFINIILGIFISQSTKFFLFGLEYRVGWVVWVPNPIEYTKLGSSGNWSG